MTRMKTTYTLFFLTSAIIFFSVSSVLDLNANSQQILTSNFVLGESTNNLRDSIFYRMADNPNYTPVSSNNEDGKDDDTKYICNKLLESCPSQKSSTQNEDSISNADKQVEDEISNKYFEHQDTEVGNASLINESSTQNITAPMINESSTQNITAPMINESSTQNITAPMINESSTQNITAPMINESSTQNITAPMEDGLETISNQTSVVNEIRYQNYENSNQGFTISYPIEWEKIENATERYFTLSLLSPPETSEDKVQERLILRINLAPIDMSLDEYTQRVKDTIQNNNLKVSNFSSTTLSGYPAYRFEGMSREGIDRVDLIDNWTMKDGIVYRMVYYFDGETAEIHLPVANKIMQSFTITK